MIKQSATVFNLLLFLLLLSNPIAAADPQKCTIDETCKIGEFLYDDDYVPITTATCNITSRDPDGNLYLDNLAMTHSTGGYYIYSITPTVLGHYPTQVCCSVNSENMCLDKTFEVVSADTGGSSLTAADVWGYSNRSLTSFGDLVSDIWTRSDRTLTQAVSVNTTYLTTKTEILEIKKQNQENRILLEQVVNKPVIENFIDDSSPVDLEIKLTETQSVLNSLFTTSQNLKNKIQLLADNWDKISTTQARSELSEIKEMISSQNSTSTIVSHINWLKVSWGGDPHINLSTKANNILSQIEILESKLSTNNLSTLQPKIQSITLESFGLDNLIGNTFSEANSNTAFGHFQAIKQTSDKLVQVEKKLVENIGQKEDQSFLDNITFDLLSVNQIGGYDKIIKPYKNNTYRNKIYSLLSLTNLNKKVLAGDNSKTIKQMWLEDGSVVFRAVASNPSKSINQSVDVKFYLPEEVKKEQIINSDPLLKIEYDPIKKSLFAATSVNLSPLESVTFSIEVEDIWHYSQEEIDIIKKHATDIADSLKGYNNYTQALALKSDIHTTLDKVLLRQSQAITPESRIKTYRESALDVLNAEEKIENLKEFVYQNSANGALGLNSQSLATIGIIIMGLASFLFLGYYLKTLSINKNQMSVVDHPGESLSTRANKLAAKIHRKTHNRHYHRLTTISIIGLFTSGLVSLLGSIGYSYYQSQKLKNISLQQTYNNPISTQVTIMADESKKVVAKTNPSIVAPQVITFEKPQQVYVYKKLNGWVKVGYTQEETPNSWWVGESYIK